MLMVVDYDIIELHMVMRKRGVTVKKEKGNVIDMSCVGVPI